MAEERIKGVYFKECNTKCDAVFDLTREEAIERMVLAMHNEDIKRSIKDIPCDYRNLAEAALNALLEGK